MLQNTLHKQTGRFIGAIAANLPEISTDVMQGWIENPIALQKVLKEALCPQEKEIAPITKARQEELQKFSITIGGKSKETLMGEVSKKYNLGLFAEGIIKNEQFTVLPQEEKIEVEIITPLDLGFNFPRRYRGFLDTIKKHPKYEACSGEEMIYLYLTYNDQLKGKFIRTAMPILTCGVNQGVLSSDGLGWLNGQPCDYETEGLFKKDLWLVRVRK